VAVPRVGTTAELDGIETEFRNPVEHRFEVEGTVDRVEDAEFHRAILHSPAVSCAPVRTG
jgi:hypothetical protein